MKELIKIKDIPASARKSERLARSNYLSKIDALEAAKYQIVLAPGCYSGPSNDPPVVGWVLTRVAAIALSECKTKMPDGSSHSRLRFIFHGKH